VWGRTFCLARCHTNHAFEKFERSREIGFVIRATEAAWVVSLGALLVYSGLYSYRRVEDQPAYYGESMLALRVAAIVLLATVVNELYQVNRINAALEILATTIGGVFLVMYGAYVMQIRGRASRMSTAVDPNEVRRYRRTARWTIDLEIKEGARRR
jgi:hypothetical protein